MEIKIDKIIGSSDSPTPDTGGIAKKKINGNFDNIVEAINKVLEVAEDLNGDDKFLNKKKADTAAELITFLKGLIANDVKSTDYESGAFGKGMRMWLQNGKSHAEFDFVHARMEAIFNKLTIAELQSVGGQVVISPADMQCNKVEETANYYRCYFDTRDGSIPNRWTVGAQARCQTWTGTQKYYWRLVVGVGSDYIDLSKTDSDGTSIPEAKDAIVQLGHRTDPTRQNAIILSAYGVDAPSIKQYNGIRSYSFDNSEATVISPNANKFVGDFRIKSGDKTIPIPADKGLFISGEEYRYYDRVSHNGALWLCVIEEGKTTLEEPSDTSQSWQKQVAKGLDGAKGDKGDTGEKGLQGLQGEKGTQGIAGEKGADGKTTYTHIAYADDASGGGFSQEPSGKAYLGIYVDTIELDSTDVTKYKWSLVKGAQGDKGDKGIAGAVGADGRTPYLHIAYADDANGGGFSQLADGKAYIGTYTDYVEADSTDVTKYAWLKSKGENGTDGKDAGLNLLKWQDEWQLGNGILPNWVNSGSVAENERIIGDNPFGIKSTLWKCSEIGNGEQSGGFDTNFMALDTNFAYRYCVFVFKTKATGNQYHGTNGVLNLDGSANNNPYFWQGVLPAGKWYMLVGIVHPHSASMQSGMSGVYDMQGNKIENGTDFKQSAAKSVANFRSYNYYETDTQQAQYFYNPMLHKLDGTEPTIEQLLKVSTRKEVDAAISAAAADATAKDNAVKATAELYAEAKAEEARVKAASYADGKVTAEEARAIADATAKADAARKAAIEAASVDATSKDNVIKRTYDKMFESTDERFISVINETRTYTDGAVKKTYSTIDALGLDPNKFYPVTFKLPLQPCSITIKRGLNSAYGVPPYATHPNGFSVLCKWSSNGNAWDEMPTNRIVNQYKSFWHNNNVIGSIGQMSHSSREYIYVRGGSKYDVQVDGLSACEITLHASYYTELGETITPLLDVIVPVATLDETASTIKRYADEQVKIANDAATAAKVVADKAVLDAKEANERLANWASDSYISPTEKVAMRSVQVQITNDKLSLVKQAEQYSVDSSVYSLAYDRYNAQLTNHTAATPENITVDAQLTATQTAYNEARINLTASISIAAKKDATAKAEAARLAAIEAASADATAKDNAAELNIKKYITEKNYSSIEQTKDSIDLSINNVKVGGNNFLLKSNLQATNGGYPVTTYEYAEPLVVGETYTMVVCAQYNGTGSGIDVYYDSGYNYLGKITSVTKVTQAFTFVAKVESESISKRCAFCHSPNGSGGTSTVYWAAVYKGNKVPLEWQPSQVELPTIDKIISSINLSPEGVKIKSNKIELDGETLSNNLIAKRIRTAKSGARIETNGTMLDVYGTGAMPNIRFGIDANGYAIMQYYSSSGVFLYDLGPNGISALNFTPAKWSKRKLMPCCGYTLTPMYDQVFRGCLMSKGCIVGYNGCIEVSNYYAGGNPVADRSKEPYTWDSDGTFYVADGWYAEWTDPRGGEFAFLLEPLDGISVEEAIQDGLHDRFINTSAPIYVYTIVGFKEGLSIGTYHVYMNT